jgi:hypothetical protein
MSLRDGFHGAGGVMVPVCRFALLKWPPFGRTLKRLRSEQT